MLSNVISLTCFEMYTSIVDQIDKKICAKPFCIFFVRGRNDYNVERIKRRQFIETNRNEEVKVSIEYLKLLNGVYECSLKDAYNNNSISIKNITNSTNFSKSNDDI